MLTSNHTDVATRCATVRHANLQRSHPGRSTSSPLLLVLRTIPNANIGLHLQASKHSFGAEQYWEWARIFSRLAHTDVDNGLSDLIVPFLDIGKEGELQGQIKSVVRDLEIMLQITTEQMEVVEKFEKTMQQLVIARGSRSDQTLTVPDAELLLDEIQSSIDDLDNMRRSADDISASVSSSLPV